MVSNPDPPSTLQEERGGGGGGGSGEFSTTFLYLLSSLEEDLGTRVVLEVMLTIITLMPLQKRPETCVE